MAKTPGSPPLADFGVQLRSCITCCPCFAGSKAICYDAAAHGLNSTAWFADYLGSFMEYVTVGDLQLFADELTVSKNGGRETSVHKI